MHGSLFLSSHGSGADASQPLRDAWDATSESYDLTTYAPVLITIEEPVATSNPLEREAYDRRRIYPWRCSYYDRYGYSQIHR